MVDTVQPQRFAGFRNRLASSLLMKMNLLRWNNAKPTPGPDTRPASSIVVGLDVAEKIRASGVGRKMFGLIPLERIQKNSRRVRRSPALRLRIPSSNRAALAFCFAVGGGASSETGEGV